jgi:hypothetical protein
MNATGLPALPTVETLASNVASVYDRAAADERAAGALWYPDAHAFAHGLTAHGLTLDQACGVTAALSPRVSWAMNQRLALSLARGEPVRGLGLSLRKARAIMAGDPVEAVLAPPRGQPRSGQKVRAFHACIRHPWTATDVAVDRHAFDIAMGVHGDDRTRDVLDRAGVYARIAHSYSLVADTLGVLPSTIQATTWLAWRREKGLT